MKRVFWLAMGITIGALIVRKISRAAQRMSPQGIAHSMTTGLGNLTDAVRDFVGDVREEMADREAQLREGTGLDGTLDGPRR